jgi:hypothetical protein
MLRIEFTSVTGTPAENVIYVDPSHGWRVVERRVEASTAAETDRWTYGVVVGGVEFPSEFKTLTTFKGASAPPNMEITGRLIRLQVTEKTPEDFRLSAFGIPEPVDVGPPPNPTRWYLWLLAAAGCCAAFSLGFAYLRRRQRRHAAAPVPGASP